MQRALLAFACIGALLALGACSSDDDPSRPVVPDDPEALADFWNFLVADGTMDTRLDFFQDSNREITTGIGPAEGSTRHVIHLASATADANLGYRLTNPASVPLESSGAFPMVGNRRYRLVVCGVLDESDPNLAPRMVQMDSLAAPTSLANVTFRIFHSLAGNPVEVDVYVNDKIITGLGFGEVSAPVTFTARAASQDALVIVPAGQVPNGSNEIYGTRDSSLFSPGHRYEATVLHAPTGTTMGNINGAVQVSLWSRGPDL